MKIVFFFNVTLNLNNNSYKPFSKANTIPKYINVCSNHPASIVKQIPTAINIIINRLSSNYHKEFYYEDIHNSGYKDKLKYVETN